MLVDIGAYCLMPNHFHLLVREKNEGGIQKFMLKLLTAYSMYFNKKNERSGSLFENRFRALHVDDDDYLRYLLAYIHLNPIKLIDPHWKENGIRNTREAKQYLAGYQHSSYLDYTEGERYERAILNPEAFPKYFQTPNEFKDMVAWWLEFTEVEPRWIDVREGLLAL